MFGRIVAEEICSERLYSFHYTVKHMHEYYAQKKQKGLLCNYVTQRTEKDVTQRSIQISANQPAN